MNLVTSYTRVATNKNWSIGLFFFVAIAFFAYYFIHVIWVSKYEKSESVIFVY